MQLQLQLQLQPQKNVIIISLQQQLQLATIKILEHNQIINQRFYYSYTKKPLIPRAWPMKGAGRLGSLDAKRPDVVVFVILVVVVVVTGRETKFELKQ